MHFEHISPKLIRFKWEDHSGLVLLNDRDAILFDPINEEAASSVRRHLSHTYNATPKYLVYSHDHPDHICGGEIFKDEAVAISHVNARKVIIEDEIPTLIPTITFSDRMSIQFGDEVVDLLYFGPNSSDSTIFPYFRSTKALFAVDVVSVKRLPYRSLQFFFVNGWLETLRSLLTLEVDIVLPGHGDVGCKEDLIDHYDYVERLYYHTLSGVRRGVTMQEIADTFDTSKVASWQKFDRWFVDNVKGMYDYIVAMRFYNKQRTV